MSMEQPSTQNKKIFFGELEWCPFDLVPGPNGRWLLWWAEEDTWIASFPSLEVACRFIVGDHSDSSNPGWDRSSVPMDFKAALKRVWRKTGKCPQFEFDETSNIFDLYAPLGLGFKMLSRLFYYDLVCEYLDQSKIDSYCPNVAKCLAGGDCGLDQDIAARIAPIITELLLRQTRSQQRLTEGWGLPRVKATKVHRMDEDDLEAVAERYDLDIDINEFNTIGCKANAVIAGLVALGKLKY